MQKTIGDRIKERREELGLSQLELAQKIGLTSKSTVCHAERSKNNFTQSKLEKFAKALDVSVSYLMGFRDADNNDLHLFDKTNGDINELIELAHKVTPEQISVAIMLLKGFVAKNETD